MILYQQLFHRQYFFSNLQSCDNVSDMLFSAIHDKELTAQLDVDLHTFSGQHITASEGLDIVETSSSE